MGLTKYLSNITSLGDPSTDVVSFQCGSNPPFNDDSTTHVSD